MFSYRMQKPMSTVNHVASKTSQSQNKTKIPNSISKNADKQKEPCNSTSKEVSFGWSLHRISTTDSKVRSALQNSTIHLSE